MLRKLSAALVFTLVCLAAPHARADDAATGDEAKTGDAAPAAEEEPSDSEASADDDAEAFDRDGWYAGIGGGGAIEYFDRGNSGNSGIAQIRAGYRFLRFAALEAQLEYTPKFEGKSGRYAGVDTATFGTWANIKGYPTAPWTGRFQPYAMVGVGWWWERRTGSAINGSQEDGAFVSRYGGGIDVYVTKNIVLTAESAWVLPTGGLDDLTQVQIVGAIQYRFDP
jgi:opacity protein-like surface antigen